MKTVSSDLKEIQKSSLESAVENLRVAKAVLGNKTVVIGASAPAMSSLSL